MTTKPRVVDVSPDELEDFCLRMRERALKENNKDYEFAAWLAETLGFMKQVLDEKSMSIKRLIEMVFGSNRSEKTRKVLERIMGELEEREKPEKKGKRKGHGRNGSKAYTGAERIVVPLEGFSPGDACPECRKGKLYRVKDPGVVIRITGQAPLHARIWELEKVRCNLCGGITTAESPPGVGDKTYDESAGSMIAHLKYGSGLPFYRLEQLQAGLGIPLPASTQWEVVAGVAEQAAPAFQELRRQAAQGEILHNDDTSMKILEFAEQAKKDQESGTDSEADGKKGKERTGVFTSAVVSVTGDEKIAIYHTGREHAGETLAEILEERTSSEDPIQMCDALMRNLPAGFKTILANCLAHGRRKFVEVGEAFPEECFFVLKKLKAVYCNDAVAKREKMSPEERLAFHRKMSGPLMESLHEWLENQFAEKKVEPNSSLGKAISYMLKRWEPLTLFLRKAGAPLDNNLAERVLKKAILHRKNSYFFKTKVGAAVGDMFMSIIETCRLRGINSFKYIIEIQKHADEVAADPKKWLPWNYREQLIDGRARDGPARG